MDRRTFLQTAAAGTLGYMSLSRSASADSKPASGEMKLKYAVNIASHFASHPILERLEMIKEAGFTAVEFNGLPWLDRKKDGPETNWKAIEEYGQRLRDLKMTQATWVTNACAGPCDSSMLEPKQRERFFEYVRRSTKIAPLVDGTISTVTSGLEIEGVSRKQMTATVIDVLKRAAEIVEKTGPTLVLEPLNVLVNHPGYHVVTTDHALEIINAVNHPRIRLLFDIYHQQISEGNLIRNLQRAKDVTAYIQFADNPGRHEPFTGEINYQNVFKAVYDMGYRGMVGGEYSPMKGKSDEASFASLEAIRRADNW